MQINFYYVLHVKYTKIKFLKVLWQRNDEKVLYKEHERNKV